MFAVFSSRVATVKLKRPVVWRDMKVAAEGEAVFCFFMLCAL